MTIEENRRQAMTVNYPSGGMQPNYASAFSASVPDSDAFAAGWTGPGDAVQLTRLGGVLNAFQTDAMQSSGRVDRLSPLVRNRDYSVSGEALGRKLITDMLQHK
jgi:hypothetical protein